MHGHRCSDSGLDQVRADAVPPADPLATGLGTIAVQLEATGATRDLGSCRGQSDGCALVIAGAGGP